MNGNAVRLIRYLLTWQEPYTGWQEESVITEYRECIAASEAERDELLAYLAKKNVKVEVTEIDQTDNEWIAGLVFDSYEAAQAALEAGEEAYLASQKPAATMEEVQRLEQEITTLQLALVELYEGGAI
jgi:hypothetical protein